MKSFLFLEQIIFILCYKCLSFLEKLFKLRSFPFILFYNHESVSFFSAPSVEPSSWEILSDQCLFTYIESFGTALIASTVLRRSHILPNFLNIVFAGTLIFLNQLDASSYEYSKIWGSNYIKEKLFEIEN